MNFKFKKKINIKTKYNNVNYCLKNCRDIKQKTYSTYSFSESISGEVELENNTFELSSVGKNARNVVFNGNVIEDKGIIYMRGEIKPRLGFSFIIYGIRVGAIYTLLSGVIDLYINRDLVINLYDPMLLLLVSFLALYFIPKLLFYLSYKSLVNNVNNKVNQ